jgi:flavin reductase (DIM6/NTAB) family NADH-FMN oxidoreductase RutF
MDLFDSIRFVINQYAPVVAVGLAIYAVIWFSRKLYAAFKSTQAFVQNIVDERLPEVIHEQLNNGLKKMVTEVVEDAIKNYDERQKPKFERIDTHNLRMNDLEGRVEELEHRRPKRRPSK